MEFLEPNSIDKRFVPAFEVEVTSVRLGWHRTDWPGAAPGLPAEGPGCHRGLEIPSRGVGIQLHLVSSWVAGVLLRGCISRPQAPMGPGGIRAPGLVITPIVQWVVFLIVGIGGRR